MIFFKCLNSFKLPRSSRFSCINKTCGYILLIEINKKKLGYTVLRNLERITDTIQVFLKQAWFDLFQHWKYLKYILRTFVSFVIINRLIFTACIAIESLLVSWKLELMNEVSGKHWNLRSDLTITHFGIKNADGRIIQQKLVIIASLTYWKDSDGTRNSYTIIYIIIYKRTWTAIISKSQKHGESKTTKG